MMRNLFRLQLPGALTLRRPTRRAFVPGLALLFVLPAVVFGASIESDLGDDLRYHRVQQLPQDLPARPEKPAALILDLRYVSGGDDDAKALQAWLKFRGNSTAPVMILANGETSAALRRIVTSNRRSAGVITVGPAHPDFTPDILVTPSAEAERRAYDALAQGTAITALLSENADKPRTDEATIMRDRANLPDERIPADDDEFLLEEGEKPPVPRAEPPPTDVALQRAVHIYRALRALKRL